MNWSSFSFQTAVSARSTRGQHSRNDDDRSVRYFVYFLGFFLVGGFLVAGVLAARALL